MVLTSANGNGNCKPEEEVQNSTATEDVWEIVDHLLKSYNQQCKTVRAPPLQDLPESQLENARGEFAFQHEPGKERKIQQLAQEFDQQSSEIPILEHLQVINEEDLAAILPDVENNASDSFDEFDSLGNRTGDNSSTLVESLNDSFDNAVLLNEPNQIIKEATHAGSSEQNELPVEQMCQNYLATSKNDEVDIENPLHLENSDLINQSIYNWLLKPSSENSQFSSALTCKSENNTTRRFQETEMTRRRSLRITNSKVGSPGEGENNNDYCAEVDPSIKIDCSVSHISLDSGFGGSPSYTSSPTSAYMYSPLSVDHKSPASCSAFNTVGMRSHFEPYRSKRSCSPPERILEKLDDETQSMISEDKVNVHEREEGDTKRGPGRPKKKNNKKNKMATSDFGFSTSKRLNPGKKSRADHSTDIFSLVEKFISIEEQSKKIVRKSPNRHRIEKVRRWLKLKNKSKSKKKLNPDSTMLAAVDNLVLKFTKISIEDEKLNSLFSSNPTKTKGSKCKLNKDRIEGKFSRTKVSTRRKEKMVENFVENVASEKSISFPSQHSSPTVNKKKLRKLETNHEENDQRLPLKKRQYHAPQIIPRNKTESVSLSSANLCQQNKEVETVMELSEADLTEVPGEKKSKISSSKILVNESVNKTILVTPKKRFQMKHLACTSSRDLTNDLCEKTDSPKNAPPASLKSNSSELKSYCDSSKSQESTKSVVRRRAQTETSNKPSKSTKNNQTKQRGIETLESLSPQKKTKSLIKDLRVSISHCDVFLESGSKKCSTFLNNVSSSCAESEDRKIDSKDSGKSVGSTSMIVDFTEKNKSANHESRSLSVVNPSQTVRIKKRKRTINRTGFPTKKKKKYQNSKLSLVSSQGLPKIDLKKAEKTIEFSNSTKSQCMLNINDHQFSEDVRKNESLSPPDSLSISPCKNIEILPNDEVKTCPVPNESVESQTENSTEGCLCTNIKSLSTHSNERKLRRRKSVFVSCLCQNSENELQEKFSEGDLSKDVGCKKFKRIKPSSFKEKRYLVAGLFSDFYKKSSSFCTKESSKRYDPEKSKYGLLPPPVYCSKWVRQRRIDFTLPYDIWLTRKKSSDTKSSLESKGLDLCWPECSSETDIPCDNSFKCIQNSSFKSTIDLPAVNQKCSLSRINSTSAKLSTQDCDKIYSHKNFLLLPVEAKNYIRNNHCFLVRNLTKVKRLHLSSKQTFKNCSLAFENSAPVQKNSKSSLSLENFKSLAEMTPASFQIPNSVLRETEKIKSQSSGEGSSPPVADSRRKNPNPLQHCGKKTLSAKSPALDVQKNLSSLNFPKSSKISLQVDCDKNFNFLNPLETNLIPQSSSNFKAEYCPKTNQSNALCTCDSESSKKLAIFCNKNGNKNPAISGDERTDQAESPFSAEGIPHKASLNFAKTNCEYFEVLFKGSLKVQIGDNVYVEKDISSSEVDSIAVTAHFGNKNCDIFHIERLWKDYKDHEYAYGYYFLRPSETFHEPTRKFFPNELMRSPLSEKLPLSRIVGHCHVLNLNTYCKGKPAGADLNHVFICEYRVDKAAKTFSRIPKRKAHFSSENLVLEMHSSRLKPVRNFKPYDLSSHLKSRKKHSEDFNCVSSLIKKEATFVSRDLIQSLAQISVSDKSESDKASKALRLNSIINELSKTAVLS